MAHEIDELAPGVHGFASARVDAWHRLGVTLDSTFDAQQAMDAAHLGGWNVRKAPMFYQDDPESAASPVPVPDRWATVRTNPVTGYVEYLGTVGSHYTPIQNEEHAELLNALVDESGAHFETAGSLRGGRETFITMKMPDTMQVGGKDAVDLNLVALNSHDGNSAFRFLVSPVRVVCANTQAAAIRSAKATFSIRHTGKAGRELQEAREALGLTWKYVEAFQAEAEALLARRYTNKQFDAYAAQLFGITDEGKASKRAIQNRDGLISLYRDSDTLTGIRGTRWGAYQAVTEYVDHYAPANGEDQALARATRTITSHKADGIKKAAFALL
ncbi:DUF945 domain-containing protein [Microbacterium resistens]|uniref:DUF945 domain-containing protein n=1 Tax=Microbacterium resistens TaxID=156977 RepID=A0ABY3RTW6_9MICO|nr:DUF932 domain-containing protein [Microbacterium resistens]UGS26344.1 DUF945 domain-containing protein [Microbacterium resistens]